MDAVESRPVADKFNRAGAWTICGAGNEGPGAIFERTYTVYLVEAA